MKKYFMNSLRKGYHFFKIGLMVFFVSCNDYLDVKSDMELETIESIESLELLMDGAQFMNFNVNSFGEASADDYWLTGNTYKGQNENTRNIYIWNHFRYTHNNDWAKGYIPIYHANLVIDRCEAERARVEGDKRWGIVYGTALFFRAYQHMCQVFTYSKAYREENADYDKGIVLRLTSDPSVKSIRSTNRETYKQIEDDFKKSLKYLPDRSNHPMRPSKWASYGALARLYLSMNDYESAELYADSCLRISQDLMDFNNVEEFHVSAQYPIPRFNRETIFYAELTTSQPNLNPNIGLIDTLLYQSYQMNDLRRLYFFRDNADGYVSFQGNFTESQNLFGGIAVGEVFLIKAESCVKLNRIEEGIKWLNRLLQHRCYDFTPFDFSLREEALTVVRKERRKELVMRGLRWMDIKRQNVDGESIDLYRNVENTQLVLPANSSRFALPLPMDIVDQTNIEQNIYED